MTYDKLVLNTHSEKKPFYNTAYIVIHLATADCSVYYDTVFSLRGVEWVHGLFLFPHVLGKM